MRTISFEINSNNDIWNLIDKNLDYILLDQFWPYETIEWWKTELKINNQVFDLKVRNMEFDLQTDLKGLEKILNLKTNQFSVYQFEKSIPSTLVIKNLPIENKESILKLNGLKHIFICEFERLSISSIDDNFLDKIEQEVKSKQFK